MTSKLPKIYPFYLKLLVLTLILTLKINFFSEERKTISSEEIELNVNKSTLAEFFYLNALKE